MNNVNLWVEQLGITMSVTITVLVAKVSIPLEMRKTRERYLVTLRGMEKYGKIRQNGKWIELWIVSSVEHFSELLLPFSYSVVAIRNGQLFQNRKNFLMPRMHFLSHVSFSAKVFNHKSWGYNLLNFRSNCVESSWHYVRKEPRSKHGRWRNRVRERYMLFFFKFFSKSLKFFQCLTVWPGLK